MTRRIAWWCFAVCAGMLCEGGCVKGTPTHGEEEACRVLLQSGHAWVLGVSIPAARGGSHIQIVLRTLDGASGKPVAKEEIVAAYEWPTTVSEAAKARRAVILSVWMEEDEQTVSLAYKYAQTPDGATPGQSGENRGIPLPGIQGYSRKMSGAGSTEWDGKELKLLKWAFGNDEGQERYVWVVIRVE